MILNCTKNTKTNVVKYIKKKEKRYYNSMNLTNLNDNRRFWKTDEIALAETFSKFYENAIKKSRN